MNYKRMLLQENPKALQYLHHTQGFNFEKPFYLGSIPGRFTYKMISDMIRANVGPEYVAALLVKPNKSYCFNRLHHVTMDHGKFHIECRRDIKRWNYDMDYFFSVGNFEDTRKKATERVYIIAQNPDFLVTPKNNVAIVSGVRYKIAANGIKHCGDGRGNRWIESITLQPTDGSRKTATFEPWNRFYPSEHRSNDINDYIDKSGYIVRWQRMELYRRAKALKAQHDAEKLAVYDFAERERTAAATVAAVKRHVVAMIESAETGDEAAQVDRIMLNFRWMLMAYDRTKTGNFSSVDAKNRRFDEIEEFAAKILNGGDEK